MYRLLTVLVVLIPAFPLHSVRAAELERPSSIDEVSAPILELTVTTQKQPRMESIDEVGAPIEESTETDDIVNETESLVVEMEPPAPELPRDLPPASKPRPVHPKTAPKRPFAGRRSWKSPQPTAKKPKARPRTRAGKTRPGKGWTA